MKITQIEGLIKHVKELHSIIHGTAARNEDKHKQLNSAMDEIRKLFDTVKQILKTMEEKSKVYSLGLNMNLPVFFLFVEIYSRYEIYKLFS